MQRQNLDVVGEIEGQCKIRKRGNSSSSSSSLVHNNYRLNKRAILVGKRAGSSMPIPIWKMKTSSPSLQNDDNNKPMKYLPLMGLSKGKELSVSARKLGATLWEVNEVPSPRNSDGKMGGKELSCPVSERMERQGRRSSVDSQKLLLTDNNLQGMDSVHKASLVQVEAQPREPIPSRHMAGVKNRLKDVSASLTTSKELVRVLNRVWGVEEQDSTTKSLISALKQEIERARVQVEKLIREERSNRYELNYVLRQFEEEKAVWKIKEQERIHKAVMFVAREVEVEKKLRRQTERLNKKLGRELANTKAALSKAVKEIESEKRAREILEQVCDELAQGIGEDRADFEELKKESAKVREEVEKEREMLQLADVLREERVQMKLSEAKFEFEEKNAEVEMLRNELESYMREKTREENGGGSPSYERIKELEEYLRKTLSGYPNGGKEKDEKEVVNGEDQKGEDSGDSDLHSIELNMDDNSKSYEWSYLPNDSKRISVDKITARKSFSGKVQRKIFPLERKISDEIEWEFCGKNQEDSNGFDTERYFEFGSEARDDDYEEEIERYKMIKDLRDHIVSNSGLAILQQAV